jgi:hypothetical protein
MVPELDIEPAVLNDEDRTETSEVTHNPIAVLKKLADFVMDAFAPRPELSSLAKGRGLIKQFSELPCAQSPVVEWLRVKKDTGLVL